ncbi:HEAT repeat domain-containing protein [Streptomyces sp. NPDC058642]|uniref:HEAT repeat domain-containing protein n=1 Tax=Streptomyces sp. NPDC058642 TaxID=3346572 RepID=UPI003658A0C9
MQSTTAQGWAGDAVARDALILLTQDGNLRARRTAARVLAEGWPGDAIVHDALSGLAREDRHKRVRGAAARLLAAIREPGN